MRSRETGRLSLGGRWAAESMGVCRVETGVDADGDLWDPVWEVLSFVLYLGCERFLGRP